MQYMDIDGHRTATHPNTSYSGMSFGPPEIDPSEIQKLHVLGDGSFGTVYAGKCRQKDVAVKVLLKQDFDERTLNDFRHEVEVMSKIFHPNINLFMGACTVPGKMMIVTELMRGDLESMLLNKAELPSIVTRMRFAKDAALGMLWLHSSNPQTIHRDLKASNLLVDDNLTCKICDFGLSQIIPRGKSLMDGHEGAKGTPLWMAPEVMLGEHFNEKADIYSYGLILWFLYTCKEPYTEYYDLETFTHGVCIQHVRPKIPADMEEKCPGLSFLIERCWHMDPRMRPSFSDIVTRLDHIIVDCAIEDPVGRQFWKANFLSKETVPWVEFLNAFAKSMKLLPVEFQQLPISHVLTNYGELLRSQNFNLETEIKCLKAILADEPKSQVLVDGDLADAVVSIEKFGNILKFFGPLVNTNNNNHDTVNDGMSMLQRMSLLMNESWFHGDISTHESENRLINKTPGTFLVRFSTTTPGSYTISKVSLQDQSIKHQKIQHKAGGPFEINGRKYNTLKDLIHSEAQALELQTACVGSRFLALFVVQKVSGYVDGNG